VAAQALRAFAYGFGALLLGTTLERRGFTSAQAGMVLSAVVAGTVASSLAVARLSDQLGRRRCYVALYVMLGVAGLAFATSHRLVVLVAAALTGAMSTDIIDNGPFTSLEQAMLATELSGRERISGFGLYNSVAAASGSIGALIPAARRCCDRGFRGARPTSGSSCCSSRSPWPGPWWPGPCRRAWKRTAPTMARE